MPATRKPDPAFVERFARRRELFIAGLTGATAQLPSVTCRPIDGDFTFGWLFEHGHAGHPLQHQGGIEYGLSYVRHMIDQGLEVAYAISLAHNGVVHLQAFESPHEQKPWPDDPDIVFTSEWYPMRTSRKLGEGP